MSNTSESKLTRLNIRVSEHQKDVIARAANYRNTTVSNFVLEQAYVEAQAILADQSQFVIDHHRWKKICQALDAPPRDLPALRELLTKPGVYDD